MTFDLWWETVGATNTPETYRGWEASCREAYEAGAKAERESCAILAEAAAAKMGDLGRQHRDEANEDSMDRCYARSLQCTQLAADIRTRSNV